MTEVEGLTDDIEIIDYSNDQNINDDISKDYFSKTTLLKQ